MQEFRLEVVFRQVTFLQVLRNLLIPISDFVNGSELLNKHSHRRLRCDAAIKSTAKTIKCLIPERERYSAVLYKTVRPSHRDSELASTR